MTHDYYYYHHSSIFSRRGPVYNASNQFKCRPAAQQGIKTNLSQKTKLQTPPDAISISISNSPPPSIQQHSQSQSDPNDNLPPHNLSSSTLGSGLVYRDVPPAALLSVSSLTLVVSRLSPTHTRQLLRLIGRCGDGRVEDGRVGVVPLLSLL
jgi:hypothetical protein